METKGEGDERGQKDEVEQLGMEIGVNRATRGQKAEMDGGLG